MEISKFIQQHFKQLTVRPQQALLFYRLPGTKKNIAVSGEINAFDLNENQQQENTFLIAPFDVENNKVFKLSVENSIEFENVETLKISEFNLHAENCIRETSTQKTAYITGVKNALKAFENNELQKVVLSRISVEDLPQNFSPFNFFIQLTKNYPNAFVYLLISNKTGNWVGASPELLLKSDAEKLETMALAGTSHISTSKKMLTAAELFTGKEIAEQQLVTNYIEDILNDYGKVKIEHPEVISTGNLYHLCTRFNMNLQNGANSVSIAFHLHPTPAVCGLPKNKALNFINKTEAHKRNLYSGFLGPVSNNNSQFYVNLRCMQFDSVRAVFYAGAGLVPGSDAEKEWQETEEKMNTLRTVLYS